MEDYSYHYNIKIVGVSAVAERETAQQTADLCIKLFTALGVEDVSISDIDTAHRVPSHLASSRPKAIICKFVHRLAKDKVMAARRAVGNLNAEKLQLESSADVNHISLYDHLTSRIQELLYKSKQTRAAKNYKYCSAKNGFMYNDLDNTLRNNHNIHSQCIQSRYFSVHSFKKFSKKLSENEIQTSYSIFHNNIVIINGNLENLTVLLDELNFHFSIIGITETKMTNSNESNFHLTIPGNCFEQVPTPLASGGAGLFIESSLNYNILEKTSYTAFQALWIEIPFVNHKNIVCGIVYPQHNSPEYFQKYFEDKIEELVSSDKVIYIMGDFNVDLLNVKNLR